MKFVVPLIALTLSACSFEPCAYEQCVDELPCEDCADMAPTDTGEPDVLATDQGIEEDLSSPIDMPVANCVEAESCGINDGSAIHAQAVGDFFGCRRFENDVLSTVTSSDDAACNNDRHEFSLRPCENASFIVEATLSPDQGCRGALYLDVLGADFGCNNDNTTRCLTYPDGTQTVQLLVHPDVDVDQVFFVVERTTDLQVGYTLEAKAHQ